MSSTILRNKPLSLLFNVTLLLFILPNIVLCDGNFTDTDIHRIATTETKEEQKEESVDNTIVWVSIAIMYILFGVVLYLVIRYVIDRRRKNKARINAIIDLEIGSDMKKGLYKEVTKPLPVITPDSKK
uniref:Tyrosine-protein kinase-like otk n=1 Tax=Anthurium amnicola TaxID=1678845 RepID=A0A1D1YDQ1_9ARAE